MYAMTVKQRECYDYIASYMSKHGMAPKVREISKHMGYSSDASSHRLLVSLEYRGWIKRIPGQMRAIQLRGRPEYPDADDLTARQISDIRAIIPDNHQTYYSDAAVLSFYDRFMSALFNEQGRREQ